MLVLNLNHIQNGAVIRYLIPIRHGILTENQKLNLNQTESKIELMLTNITEPEIESGTELMLTNIRKVLISLELEKPKPNWNKTQISIHISKIYFIYFYI